MSNPFLSLVPTATPVTPLEAKRTLYVLVRKDIALEQQIVQATHAGVEAGRSFYLPQHGIASVILLAVPDMQALHAAQALLHAKGVKTELFHEPDFGMGDSALATEPLLEEQRKLLSSWPLWRAPVALKEAA